MRTPGFSADASFYAKGSGNISSLSPAPDGLLPISPQLGFGVGGIGVTGPADPEDSCYYCLQWVRVPCGLV
jgi:hypothetical protein